MSRFAATQISLASQTPNVRWYNQNLIKNAIKTRKKKQSPWKSYPDWQYFKDVPQTWDIWRNSSDHYTLRANNVIRAQNVRLFNWWIHILFILPCMRCGRTPSLQDFPEFHIKFLTDAEFSHKSFYVLLILGVVIRMVFIS